MGLFYLVSGWDWDEQSSGWGWDRDSYLKNNGIGIGAGFFVGGSGCDRD